MPVLASRYSKSERWIRNTLDAYTLPPWNPKPRIMPAVMDATRVGSSVLVVVRDPLQRENVWFRDYPTETTFAYQEAYQELIQQGFIITGIVGDGRVAVPYLFPVPIQMCHFHQLQIIIACTTLNPILPAAQEMLALAQTITATDRDSFTDAFTLWCVKWHDFLNEKTTHPESGKRSYTHRRLRRARTSIKTHLPLLFTYQKYPDLQLPNTTNSLDGSFAKLKTARAVHTGLRHKRQVKLLTSLLMK